MTNSGSSLAEDQRRRPAPRQLSKCTAATGAHGVRGCISRAVQGRDILDREQLSALAPGSGWRFGPWTRPLTTIRAKRPLAPGPGSRWPSSRGWASLSLRSIGPSRMRPAPSWPSGVGSRASTGRCSGGQAERRTRTRAQGVIQSVSSRAGFPQAVPDPSVCLILGRSRRGATSGPLHVDPGGLLASCPAALGAVGQAVTARIECSSSFLEKGFER